MSAESRLDLFPLAELSERIPSAKPEDLVKDWR